MRIASLLLLIASIASSATAEWAGELSIRRTGGPRPPRSRGIGGWVQCAELAVRNPAEKPGRLVRVWVDIEGGRLVETEAAGESGQGWALKEAGQVEREGTLNARRYELERAGESSQATSHGGQFEITMISNEQGGTLEGGAEVSVPFCVHYKTSWSASYNGVMEDPTPTPPVRRLSGISLNKRQQAGMFYSDWSTGTCRCLAAAAPQRNADVPSALPATSTAPAQVSTTRLPPTSTAVVPAAVTTTVTTNTATATATSTQLQAAAVTSTRSQSQTVKTTTVVVAAAASSTSLSKTSSKSASKTTSKTATKTATKSTTSRTTTQLSDPSPSTTRTYAPTNDASPYNSIVVDVDARGDEPVSVGVFMPGTYKVEVVPSGVQGFSWDPASTMNGFALRRTAVTCTNAAGCTADGTTNGYGFGWTLRPENGRVISVKAGGTEVVPSASGSFVNATGAQKITSGTSLVYPSASLPGGLPSYELYTNCW